MQISTKMANKTTMYMGEVMRIALIYKCCCTHEHASVCVHVCKAIYDTIENVESMPNFITLNLKP